MSATLEFLMAHEAGVKLPTISFLVNEMMRSDKEEKEVASPDLPISIPEEKVIVVTSDNSTTVGSSFSHPNNNAYPQHHPQPPPPANREAVKQLSVDAVRQGGVECAAVPHQRMAIGGLPPPSPYAPLQRARQQHRGVHEDPNFHHHGRGGNASTWQQEDGTLSGTTTYVDRWFEKLFFRTPLVVGGGGDSSSSDPPINRGGVGRPPSATKSNFTSTIPGDHPPAPTRPLSRTSGHRSTSSAARRLRCELFAERAAEVLRSNHPSRGPSSINSSYSQMPLPSSSSVVPTGGGGGMEGSRCAYGEAMEDYSAVSPVRRVFQSPSASGAPPSRPSSSMGVVAGGSDSNLISGHINTSTSKPIVRETKVRSRVDDAIAAAHRIRSGSARNSRPSSRLAPRTDDC